MARGTASRRWILASVVFLGFMFLSAWTIREARYSALSRSITRELTPYAETGQETPHYDSSGNLLYTDNEYLWENQGPMVWLIEHGHRDPAMLRVMLLCEARRTVDGTYLYPDCYNWDLREHLIEECAVAYPDDPLVHWATGRCHLAAGEYEQAVDNLLSAKSLGFQPDNAGVSTSDFHRRIITASIMNCSLDVAVSYARDLVAQENDVAAYHWILADLLCQLERYEEAVAVSNALIEQYPFYGPIYDVRIRALWWNGEFADTSRAYHAIADRESRLSDYVTDHIWRVDIIDSEPGMIEEHFNGPRLTYSGNRPRAQRIGYHEALVEWAVINKDIGLLDYPLEEIELSRASLAANPLPNSVEARDHEQLILRLEQLLLRAYILNHQWDKLSESLAKTEKPGWYDPKSGYQTAVLLNAIAQTGAPPPEIDPRYDFQELIEGGTLPYLLHSSHFAAATKHAGRDVDTVRAEVIAALAPTRGTYHDGANGELDW